MGQFLKLAQRAQPDFAHAFQPLMHREFAGHRPKTPVTPGYYAEDPEEK